MPVSFQECIKTGCCFLFLSSSFIPNKRPWVFINQLEKKKSFGTKPQFTLRILRTNSHPCELQVQTHPKPLEGQMIQIGHSNKKNETFRQLAPRTKKSWSPSPSDRSVRTRSGGEGLGSPNLGSHFRIDKREEAKFPIS